jgi:YVTN family beta-propeller protein
MTMRRTTTPARWIGGLLPPTISVVALLAMVAGGLALSLAVDPPSAVQAQPTPFETASPPAATDPHRSPIALAVSPDGTRLLTANQTSDSVSLVDPTAGRVLAELTTGPKPAGVAFAPDGRSALVSHWYGGEIARLRVSEDRLELVDRLAVGPEPRGVVVAPDGTHAYVAVGAANQVVKVTLGSERMEVVGRLTVGREPRSLAITPDGRTMLVGNARSESVHVLDLTTWSVARELYTQAVNTRQVTISADGKTGYLVNMKNRGFATTRNNIDLGWVLGQRVTRVPLDGSEPFQTLTLDPRGKAASDVHGVALSPDGAILAVSCGGTHEVMLFRTDQPEGLPWRTNGSRDEMHERLIDDRSRFRRVELDGRPTEIAFAADGRTLYVANYLLDAVQLVDAESARLVSTIHLGGPALEQRSMVRKGEWLFHDARRSFNQWYSCNTCHSDGHTNGQNFDTMNDGWHDYSSMPRLSKKKVPTLRRVHLTGPWTWHGWQTSLDQAMEESFTKSMQGPEATAEEVEAIVAFLSTLDFPPNPHRNPDGSLTEAARRGEKVFRSAKANCVSCHSGPEFTDGKIHDVGLGHPRDVYKGYNPPSLIGVYDKDPYLHDGRAQTLSEVLTGDHSPEVVSGSEPLTEQELDDLIAYLKSL